MFCKFIALVVAVIAIGINAGPVAKREAASSIEIIPPDVDLGPERPTEMPGVTEPPETLKTTTTPPAFPEDPAPAGINAGPVAKRGAASGPAVVDPAVDLSPDGPTDLPAETLERTTSPLVYPDDTPPEGVVTLERTTTPLAYPNDTPDGISPCEYAYENRADQWSQPGCKGQIATKPSSCVCKFGLYRREADWACVERKRCNEKCNWVWSYLGWC